MEAAQSWHLDIENDGLAILSLVRVKECLGGGKCRSLITGGSDEAPSTMFPMKFRACACTRAAVAIIAWRSR